MAVYNTLKKSRILNSMKASKLVIQIFFLIHINCFGQSKKIDVQKSNTVIQIDSLKEKKTIQNLSELKITSDVHKSYQAVKSDIKNKKNILVKDNIKLDTLASLFKYSLLNRIIPFWEGTPWSFEGHTAIPKKGEIACGYFVSTTLRDVGLQLNRYKLAQKNPIDEAHSLAIDTKVIEISEGSEKENILTIKQCLKDGIHFIGFNSSHVGYILKEKDQLYLIHSNYIGYKGVEIETIEKSIVFSNYDTFYLAEISTNKTLLERWVSGAEIAVIEN